MTTNTKVAVGWVRKAVFKDCALNCFINTVGMWAFGGQASGQGDRLLRRFDSLF